jgi:L-glyceraldehyde 3-phosphate reductase
MAYIPSTSRYLTMVYNYCGNSGLKLPAISLGLWHNFGGVDSPENARDMILAAFDAGITHFDLANNYGPPPGSAEENFGKILAAHLKSYRDEIIISTKAGYKMWDGPYGEWGSRKYLLSSLDQSLMRMNLDYVDIFYSHRPDPETPLEETMGALDQAVRQGKALYAGISNYKPDQTKRASEILRNMGTPCIIHQPKYSMFERWVEQGLLDVVEKEGIGLIAFSPLAQGLLTDRYLKGIPDGSRASKAHGFLKKNDITPEKLDKIAALNSLAKKRNQSLAQMAIAWLLKDKRVTSVLVGASSVEQLKTNLAALDTLDFSPFELEEIERLLAADKATDQKKT